jgi:Flp pilus assembly protein TadG
MNTMERARSGRRRPSRAIRPSASRCAGRCGAAAVELAIVLFAFLILVFGMLELGIVVLRSNIVSQAARQGTRRAIVRGEMAPPQFTAWGPATYTATANSDDEIAATLRPFLAGLNLERTTIQMEWIDGDNRIESRVRVTVTTAHDPFLTILFTTGWNLTGVSTMPIAH